MHDLREDIVLLFAEAQRKGRHEYLSPNQGWKIFRRYKHDEFLSERRRYERESLVKAAEKRKRELAAWVDKQVALAKPTQREPCPCGFHFELKHGTEQWAHMGRYCGRYFDGTTVREPA